MNTAPLRTPAGNRRSERASRVAAERAAQARKERRQRTILISTVAAVVLAVLVGLGVAVQASRNSTDSNASIPAGTTDGSFVVGSPGAPVTVTLYEDFLCPACAQAEKALGPTLEELKEDGTIRIDYRPIAILDRASRDRYSTRALNAAGCVIDQAPDAFPAFHRELFLAQPAEGGAGLSNARLTEIAAAAGASGVGSCIDDLQFESWSQSVTERSSLDGITQTPTILVNGAELPVRTAQGLKDAVAAAS